MTLSALAFAVVFLASFRITRFIARDSLTLAWREALYRFAWDDTNPVMDEEAKMVVPTSRGAIRSYFYELMTCSWCLGVWVSAVVYSAWRWWDTDAVRAIIVVAAVAGAQGLLASWERD